MIAGSYKMFRLHYLFLIDRTISCFIYHNRSFIFRNLENPFEAEVSSLLFEKFHNPVQIYVNTIF